MHEAQQPLRVVALRESLLLHQAEPLELGIGPQEAVGRDEVDLRGVGPAGEEGLEDTGCGRLAHRDRPGDADDVGDLVPLLCVQEALGGPEQVLRRLDIEREQARQRQVDRDHLVERDRIVQRLELVDLLGR